MKKLCTLLTVFLIFSVSSYATVLTVSNNPNAPAQYSEVQDAIDAASVGDTIYIHGSETGYGDFVVNKQLTIIGTGYNIDKHFPLISEVGTIRVDTIPGISGGSNSRFMGLHTGTITSNYDQNRSVIIEKCNVSNFGHTTASNWLVKNNIIRDGHSTLGPGFLVSNNIFASYYTIRTSSNHAVITNNIFIFYTHSTIYGEVSNHIFTNNIFYGISTYSDQLEFCTFNNNITFLVEGEQFNTSGTNSGGNNLELTNPLFVDVPYENYSFDYAFDFHLQEGSPGIGAGTDGTDIGIYGGQYPWQDGGGGLSPWQTSPVPPIPQVIRMDILNSNIPVDGTLEIEVKAIKN